MTLLNKSIKKALSIESLTEKFDAPEQAYHIKQANDGTVLKAS